MIYYIKELYRRYIDDEVPAYGAEMAYYFLLSVFPFLIFLTTILGYLPVTGDDIMGQLVNILPYETNELVRENVEYLMQTRNFRLLSFGFVSMFWAASCGMGAVIRGINKALCQKDRRPFWIAIPLSILFTFLTAVLIIFYFLLLIFGKQIGAWLIRNGLPEIYLKGWEFFRYTVAIFLMIIVFLILYRYSPCKKIRWRYALPGAIFTTVGWLIISWVFSWYVNHFWNLSLMHGSIGGIIGLLVWLFISAQLILLGGELNAILVFIHRS
ncbi:MAG: YihY/virulence factor BrkB family protein [Clostridiales bacterium]|nr:YihY/virulence factor BrkB family protein [Clostridiales bacterium]